MKSINSFEHRLDRSRLGRARRAVCAVLAGLLTIEPVLAQTIAAPISDLPLATGIASAVKPNFMFVLDDSTSMSFEFMSGSGDVAEWSPTSAGRYSSKCNFIYFDPDNNPGAKYARPPNPGAPSSFTLKPATFTAAPIDGYNRLNSTNPRLFAQPVLTAYDSMNFANASPASVIAQNQDVNLASSFPLLMNRDVVAGDVWLNFPTAFYLKWIGGTTFDPRVDCQASIYSVFLPNSKWEFVKVASQATAMQEAFANWYSFYRTRMNAMKSATGRAFSTLDGGIRLGLVTINPSDTAGKVRTDKYLRIEDLDIAQRSRFMEKIYSQVVEMGKETPLMEALSRVGRHFAGVESGINQGMIGQDPADDPVQYSCQRNVALLTTDGFYDPQPGRTVGNSEMGPTDEGTPCAAGGAGCSDASTQVAYPFNDAVSGTTRTLNIRGKGIWPNMNNSTLRAASPECDYLNGATTNIHTGEVLPTTVKRDGVDLPIAGWVPLYLNVSSADYRVVRPTGYNFEINLQATTGEGASSGSDDKDAYKITNNKSRGCRPFGLYDGSTSEGSIRKQYQVDYTPKGEITSVTPLPAGTWKPKMQGLADVAMYYYNTDLRKSGGNGFKANNKAGIDVSADNVPGGAANWNWVESDLASHQHMQTFTLGFGVDGALNYQPGYERAPSPAGDFTDIRNGVKGWLPVESTTRIYLKDDQAELRTLAAAGWKVEPARNADGTIKMSGTQIVYLPWIDQDPRYDRDKAKIDDLWHAAVNGRGAYLSARNADEVIDALYQTLGRIARTVGAGNAVGLTTREPTAADNATYVPEYTVAEWSGDLKRREIDLANRNAPTYGQVSDTGVSAAAELNTKIGAACDNRKIYLQQASGALIPFTWNSDTCSGAAKTPAGAPTTDLPIGVQTQLDARTIPEFANRNSALTGSELVNYLRGQSILEDNNPTKPAADRVFRARPNSALGDIVGSQPAFVRAPYFSYGDAGYSVFRDSFLSSGANAGKRNGTVYVGANDGMLHAFDATTMVERWAVVPHMVVDNLPRLGSRTYGANHRFFVDGTPTISDVFDGTSWRTILVGGLNAGGAGYYALDITDEANPIALWTFTNADLPANARHLGKSFGNPIVTKRADTNQWVVVVPSGYNSDTGRGVLYMLDAKDGPGHPNGVAVFDTGESPTAGEVGLAKISNWVDNTRLNNSTRFVYGGDLRGNVWRFDLTAAVGSRQGHRIGRVTGLVNGAETPLPITTAPELVYRRAPASPLVVVTTGKYLDTSDFVSTSGANAPPQGVYAFADDHNNASPSSKTRTDLQQCTIQTSATARTSSCTAGVRDSDGWYMTLPAGERITLSPQVQLGTLVFVSNSPAPNPCDGGGSNFLQYVDVESGAAVTGSAGGSIGVPLPGGVTVGYEVYFDKGTNELRVVATTVDPTKPKPVISNLRPQIAGGSLDGRRVTWRELVRPAP